MILAFLLGLLLGWIAASLAGWIVWEYKRHKVQAKLDRLERP